MPSFQSSFDFSSAEAQANSARMREHWQAVADLSARAVGVSETARPLFEKRGALLPRERLALLLDPGAPFIELSALAGYGHDHPDAAKSIPGGGSITGMGFVSGVRVVVVVSDAAVEAGSIRPMGLEKMVRAQEIALANKLPFIQLVESAGANLLQYKVQGFVHGGSIFRNLARLSAAGLPVVTVVHGSSTAGGAYMPGLSDYVIMVRGRARAFLAGPPLLKAATGEIATEEELGGGEMHASVSGLGEYLAEDDREGIALARAVIKQLDWNRGLGSARAQASTLALAPAPAPRFSAEELLSLMPADGKKPVDMREVIVRLTDDSMFMEFKALYGSATVTGHAHLGGHAVGFITNNGPIDPDGANKATHFIQACCQSGTPIIYLQNTTGYMVGKSYEQGGMIKHGSKMIQAVTNATVPQLTLMCGASFGAGNYGMCGRGFGPRFLFSWPNARTAVMGGAQAAGTMRIVAEAGAKRKGVPLDEAALAKQEARIIETFESQQSAIATSALMLDDGIIDPRDSREVLRFCLDTVREAEAREVRPMQFGVARP